MSYNTVAEFKLHAFPSGSFNELPNAVIQAALDVASSEIEAALRPHHTLPLVSGSSSPAYPAVILDAERTIASYRLLIHVGLEPGKLDDSSLNGRYTEVVGKNGLLDKLAEGKFLLPTNADATATREGSPSVTAGVDRGHRQIDSNGREWI